MMSILFLVLGLGFSQLMANTVQESLPRGELSSWCWAFLVQYVICVALLVIVDGTPIGHSLSSGLTLTCFVRIFFFLKGLKSD